MRSLKFTPSFAEVAKLAQTAEFIPVGVELSLDTLTPVGVYLKLRHRFAKAFLLESAEGGESVGRYSFVGVDPFATLVCDDGVVRFTEGRHENAIRTEKPLQAVGEFLARFKAPHIHGMPPFPGGAVGYVAYDAVRYLEKIPVPHAPAPSHDVHLMFFKRVLVFDQLKHRVYVMAHINLEEDTLEAGYKNATRDIEELIDVMLSRDASQHEVFAIASSEAVTYGKATFGEEAFAAGVAAAKKHIQCGDIFQGVLSDCFTMENKAEPFLIYRYLRMINPSPYLYFLNFGDECLLGSSPEMLVRCQNRTIETCPIAGTRPRGVGEEEDQKNEKNLLASVKEKAEHLMLVDLGRNDLGRVSELGTVNVKEFMKVERYSHVMHLVSRVTGKLLKNLSAWDAFCSCFPAGTLTGAPKIRAMEIISTLEKQRRGTYGGAVVYHDFSGNLNSCITIRSLFLKNGRGYVQAGAGLVADSQAKREYEEIRHKAKAVHKALQLATEAERS